MSLVYKYTKQGTRYSNNITLSTKKDTRVLEPIVSRHLDKVRTVALALSLCPHHWAASYLVLAKLCWHSIRAGSEAGSAASGWPTQLPPTSLENLSGMKRLSDNTENLTRAATSIAFLTTLFLPLAIVAALLTAPMFNWPEPSANGL
ncbi:hypothetical protein DL98DRAFT_626182 [Cadophora sp. DSE1049]|nr:hypothetical protein DL98DRAFT_626182 [Cadophora sp. DSE1049]